MFQNSCLIHLLVCLFIVCFVYLFFSVAPIKALCSERYEDWKVKFGGLGLQCCELTGDSQLDDYFELQRAHIVMTTPVCFVDAVVQMFSITQNIYIFI